MQFLEEELQLKYNLVTNTIWSRGEPTPGSFLNTPTSSWTGNLALMP